MTYAPDGLLNGFTDPNSHTSSMNYDNLGQLIRETDPVNASTTLARTDEERSSTASLTTALGHTTTYQTESLTTGDERRINTSPDGVQAELFVGADGRRKATQPDGIIDLLEGPDPRFSMQAPIAKSVNITRGGLTSTVTVERMVGLADSRNPLSLTSLADTLTVNGRVFKFVFDATTRTVTSTSAAGRQSTLVIDPQSRLTHAQVADSLLLQLPTLPAVVWRV